MNPHIVLSKRMVLGIVLFAAMPVSAQEDSGFSLPNTLKGWFQTPEQQAQRAWESGDNESLSKIAPNALWEGAAAYRQGDFESAKEAFAGATNAAQASAATPAQAEALARSMFNQATADIQLGNYAQAIQQLDNLLAEQPSHADALRNKAVAERLFQLEQQASQDQQSGEQGEPGDESEESNESENSDESEGSEDANEQGQQSSDSDSSDGESSEQQGESGEQQGDSQGESDNQNDASGEEESDDEIEAARQALQAAGEASEELPSDADSQVVNAEIADEPLTEQDQASEQWLRQIPDDPDDLLRRKLLQNHRSEFPDVQVHGQGW